MGANTIRISGWNNDLDHGFFLDEAHRWGLKVLVTFGLGNVWQSPVQEEWQMQGVSARGNTVPQQGRAGRARVHARVGCDSSTSASL